MTVPIVIIDDDKVDRYLIRRTIQESEVAGRVIEYKAGDEFLEVLGDTEARQAAFGVTPPPMLVLMDINMPRMNGFEVLQAMERDLGETAHDCVFVIVFSSSNNPKDRERALSYGFVKDYVVKPLTSEKLQDVVAEHCG